MTKQLHFWHALERNIPGFVGIAPAHETLIGMAGNLDADRRNEWRTKPECLGREGA